jgi:coenzyme F420 hydrogenase subunit beta
MAGLLPVVLMRRSIGAGPLRKLCTDCGVSRSSDPGRCGKACQFIKPDYPAAGRTRAWPCARSWRQDELHFGPFRRMVRARMSPPVDGAQWTGIATSIGERLLRAGGLMPC